jgi:hypothetical protein
LGESACQGSPYNVLSKWMCISLKAGSIRYPFASIASEAGSLAFTDLIFPFSISILKRSVFVPITSSFSYSKPVSRRTFLGNSFLSQLIDREIACFNILTRQNYTGFSENRCINYVLFCINYSLN